MVVAVVVRVIKYNNDNDEPRSLQTGRMNICKSS